MKTLSIDRDHYEVIGEIPNPEEYAAFDFPFFFGLQWLRSLDDFSLFDLKAMDNREKLKESDFGIIKPTLKIMGEHALTLFDLDEPGVAELTVMSSVVPKNGSQRTNNWHPDKNTVGYTAANIFPTEFKGRNDKILRADAFEIACFGPDIDHRSPSVPENVKRVWTRASVNLAAYY
jgi:hypothetical protein